MINRPKILKKAGHYSITEEMLVSITVGLFLSLLVGIILKFSVVFWVQTEYLSEKNITGREQDSVADLQAYVSHYALGTGDMRHVDEWVKSANYLYVLIYKDGELFFESGNYAADTTDNARINDLKNATVNSEQSDGQQIHTYSDDMFVKLPTRDNLFQYTAQNEEYTIVFRDDVLTIRVAEYSEYMYYALSNVLGLFGGTILFLTFFVLRIHNLTARIRKLGKEVVGVAAGDIEHEISINGNDEVAELSSNIDNMRQSLVYSYKIQRDAQQANVELITAMSHDIRTPLTVLLGYIDMMKIKNDNAEIADYIQASEYTALRLKQMSDDMFNYFRLFGGTELKTELEIYPVSTLISQLLEEYIFMLGEKGYSINSNIDILNTVPGVEIKTDAPQLARIVENIFSNIVKYADKNEPVDIILDVNDEFCKLSFANNISKHIDNVESNNIGLKTCGKIANALNIQFETKSDDDVFVATVVMPIYTEEAETVETVDEKSTGSRASRVFCAIGGFVKRIFTPVKTGFASLFRRK